MPEDKQLRSSGNTKKNKKKKRKKVTASITGDTEKPQAVSLPPETLSVSLLPPRSPDPPRGQLPELRASSQKNRERLAGSGRRSKKHPKDSPALLTATNTTNNIGLLTVQARETLRWEGVLEDPQAEEKRLELYRANRRQRYNAHRDALLKETQAALRQTVPQESKEETALTESDQQESSLHRLN
ncbi:protein LIAT1 [Clinocottus analis]|uniref:protein LIAT1 n=1 Tax=Clinocottus analis TaxID=304258 RepID=UPI0035C083E1